MAKNDKVIEDALFQIKNLEESLNRNAQGILSSTMRDEISSLVKESLKEQEEIDTEDTDTEVEDADVDVDNEGEVGAEEDVDNEMDMEMDMEMEPPAEPEDDDTIDLTKASDAEVLRVFKAMGDNDGVIIKKDDNMLHLSDSENDTEYLIQLAESEDEDELMEMDEFMSDADFDMEDELEEGEMFDLEDVNYDVLDEMFDDEEYDELEMDDFEDEDEFGMDDFDYSSLDEDDMTPTIEPEFQSGAQAQAKPAAQPAAQKPVAETLYELEIDMDDDEDMDMDDPDMYDFEFGSPKMGGEYGEEFDMDYSEFDEGYSEEEFEAYMNESKKQFRAKGTGMGSASKFKYGKKPNQDYKPKKMKQGTRGVGMGKAKFEYKEEVNDEGFGKTAKKKETKEASRTLGSGKYWGREGLPKPRTAPKGLRKESAEELNMLRAKNDEYRKALDLFRTKLNEVAIFNSNLAYATRLFTEHSTTKQEKINILRRFDNVDTLKESKNLYKVIRTELGGENTKGSTISESFQRTVEKAPTTGSAVNLIESKTYENPQFLRMKDLMAKIK